MPVYCAAAAERPKSRTAGEGRVVDIHNTIGLEEQCTTTGVGAVTSSIAGEVTVRDFGIAVVQIVFGAAVAVNSYYAIAYHRVVAYCAVSNPDCAVDIVVMSTSIARSDTETPETVRPVRVAAFTAGPEVLRNVGGGLTINDYIIQNVRFAVFTVEYSASQ
ncbi:hypothetical protein ES703_55047 [subsurface metagenome]